MAFDTNVAPPSPAALDIKPPQYQSPLEAAAGFQQLQMGRLQQQAAQQEIQQRQIQMDQMKATNDAYRNALTISPDGTTDIDMGKLTQAMVANGHGSAMPGIQKVVTEYKQASANLADTQQKVAAAEADAGGRLGAAVKQAGNDPHLFLTLAQHAIQSHELDPKLAASFIGPVQAALTQDPTGASARSVVDGIVGRLIASSPKQQELANQQQTAQGALMRGQAAQSQAGRANAQQDLKDAAADLATASTPAEYTQKLDALPHGLATKFPVVNQVFDDKGQPLDEGVQRVRFVGMTPAEQSAAVKPQKESNPTEASLAMIATDPTRPQEERDAANAALKRLDQSKIAARPIIQTVIPGLGGGQAGGGSAAQLSGDEYLRSLPAGTANQIRAIAEGRAALPSGSSRSQAAIALRNAVFQYDPTFSDQKAQIRKAFTAGTDGRNIGALNTATVHLDQLGEVAKAMQNGSFRPGNQVWNAARTMFGGAAPTNFEGVKAAVASEIASALKGNATDQEIHSISANIRASNSPAQLAGFIDTQLHVLGAKLNTYHERYQQQIPGDTAWSPVLPSARAVFEKHGLNPTAGPSAANAGGGTNGGASAISVKAPNGKTYTFKSQQDAENFRKAAGIQ